MLLESFAFADILLDHWELAAVTIRPPSGQLQTSRGITRYENEGPSAVRVVLCIFRMWLWNRVETSVTGNKNSMLWRHSDQRSDHPEGKNQNA